MANTDLSLADLRPLRPDVARPVGGGLVAAAAPALAVDPGSADALLLSDAARARQALGADRAPGSAPGAAAALSDAGRALSRLVAALPREPGPLAGTSPLLPDAPGAQAGELAHALSATLVSSGLFYESHLAALAAGRPAQIDAEPQARWATSGRAASEPASTVRVLSHDAPAAAPLPLHHDAQLLLARQLELHATGVFQWHGEAWPGVAMRWSVGEDAPHRDRAPVAEPPPRAWTTAFDLALPHLGAVNVRLRLCGPHLAVDIDADAQAGGVLRQALPELQSRLTRAEFTATACAVATGAAR